ncbi:MAG: AlpA family phage regulatory protein [Chlorobiaceae bacterium]|nr:AlpA family phage regulatory protein [Chlorobiaceae bacterium]
MKFYRLEEIIGDRKKEVVGVIPMSKSAWYLGIQKGRYPKPVKLSERSSAWHQADIEELEKRLKAGKWDRSAE